MTERAINIHDAKTHFSKLVERAEAGEEIIISRSGRPVAKLVRLTTRTRPRTPGLWEGQIELAPDFDATPDEIIEAFEE